MSVTTTLARPYAKAAFAEALVHNRVAAWSQLLQIAAVSVQQPEVVELLRDPRCTTDQRLSFLFEVCGVYLDEQSRNFLQLLAQKNRLMLLPEITELFEKYRTERAQTSYVEITSAMPLSATEQKNLARALSKRLQGEVILDCKVDKSLVGGVMIRAGDLVIDGSIMGKLERLSASLID